MRRRSRRSRTPRIPRKAVKKSHRKKFQKGGYRFENKSGTNVDICKLVEHRFDRGNQSTEVAKRNALEAMREAFELSRGTPLFTLATISNDIEHGGNEVEEGKGSLNSDLVVRMPQGFGFAGQTITLSGDGVALERGLQQQQQQQEEVAEAARIAAELARPRLGRAYGAQGMPDYMYER